MVNKQKKIDLSNGFVKYAYQNHIPVNMNPHATAKRYVVALMSVKF